MPSLDMVYRWMSIDAGAAAAFTGMSEKARVAATATQDLTAASLRSADAQKLAADASMRAADLRLRASTAMVEAQRLETTGSREEAVAAREAANALRMQATAAGATSRELNAMAVAQARQVEAIKASRDVRAENQLTATSFHGLIGQASGLTSAMESIPTPVTVVAGALGKLGLVAGVTGAAIAAFSIDEAQKFQTAMTRLHTQANVSTADVGVLSKGVLAMAGSVATTPAVLADAAYHIASIGQNSLTTTQQLAVLKIAAEGAALGGANLVDVTNALDAAIVAKIPGVRNYSQAMGVLNATVGAGDMSMQDLAEAFGPLGAVMANYGVNIQQVGAALATFGDNNLRGALAGTQLRMSVQALAVPVKAGQTLLQSWGISSGNLTKQLQHGGLTEALDVLKQKMRENGVTAKTQGDVLTEAFGKRAGVGLSVLMRELDRFHGKLGEVGRGGDHFASSWKGYTQTFSYNLDRAKAAAESFAIKLGDRLLPTATSVLRWLGTTGVKDLNAFAHWFERNGPYFGQFFAALIQEFKLLGDESMIAAKIVIDSMDNAFGWIPGIGGKLHHARQQFDSFYAGWNHAADAAANEATVLGDALGSHYTEGIIRGMEAHAQAVHDLAAKIGAGIDGATRGPRGVNAASPSKKAIKTGKDYVDGLAVGLKSKNVDIYHTMHGVGHLLYEGLSAGWTGMAGRVKNLLGTQVENELNHVTSVTDKWLNTYQGRLKSARSTLHQLRQQFRSDVSSLAGSISGGSDLSNLFGTDANGNPTMGYASQFLSAQVGPLRQFSQDLARLRKMGLRSDLLSEIANLGPGQGDQVARQILSGQDGSVASLNSLQSQITSYAKASATTVEGAAYAGRFRTDEHAVRHQSRLLAEVRDEIRRLRHETAHATARHVHVHIDSHGRLKVTGEDAREIAKAINREIKHGDVKIGKL